MKHELFLECRLEVLRGEAAPGCAIRNIGDHTGTGRQADASPDVEVVGNAAASANQRTVSDGGAAGKAGKSAYCTATADLAVVPDLTKIVE